MAAVTGPASEVEPTRTTLSKMANPAAWRDTAPTNRDMTVLPELVRHRWCRTFHRQVRGFS